MSNWLCMICGSIVVCATSAEAQGQYHYHRPKSPYSRSAPRARRAPTAPKARKTPRAHNYSKVRKPRSTNYYQNFYRGSSPHTKKRQTPRTQSRPRSMSKTSKMYSARYKR